MRKIDEITDVLVTYRMWDIVARIETESQRKLDTIIFDLHRITEITQTSTLVGA